MASSYTGMEADKVWYDEQFYADHNSNRFRKHRSTGSELEQRFGANRGGTPYQRVLDRERKITERLCRGLPQAAARRVFVREYGRSGYVIAVCTPDGSSEVRLPIRPHQLDYKKLRPRILLLL